MKRKPIPLYTLLSIHTQTIIRGPRKPSESFLRLARSF